MYPVGVALFLILSVLFCYALKSCCECNCFLKLTCKWFCLRLGLLFADLRKRFYLYCFLDKENV